MRVLVCGGRDFVDALDVERILRPVWKQITCLIHGGAPGADQLAGLWALDNNVPVKVFKAKSDHQRVAGSYRNRRMLEEGKPDYVIAFPGGKFTKDMIVKARAAGVPVMIVPARQQTGENHGSS